MMKRLLLLASVIWLTCAAMVAAPADIKCRGIVVDEQNEPIIGASVVVPGTSIATATDIDGRFVLTVPQGKAIRVTYIGYKPVDLKAAAELDAIVMEIEATVLKDVVIEQSAAKTRQTPVAVSTIGAQTLDIKLGNQELPEVLKTTPGVWTTKDGGGFGDAKTNVRGFKSENVAVMINGIPVNDMEWGGTYWSNWGSLADVTSNIQVQRGLGATIVSAPSVGGTINITTRTIDVEKGGSVWYGMGNDGLNNYGAKVSTGLMKNGWAVTVLGSRKWGEGYVQGTPYNLYNYFVNVSKRINENHQISFTGFGAIQNHIRRPNQRSGLSIEAYQTYAKTWMDGASMYRFNPTYGYDNYGHMKTQNRNNSHKPQFSINHIWKIDETSSLSSAVYLSLCDAGGYSGQGSGLGQYTYSSWYGATDGVLNMDFRRPDGTFDYGKVQDINRASTHGSDMVMSNGVNQHTWVGLVSSYRKEIDFSNGNRLNITGGIDLRYYRGRHYNEIVDLYEGDYFIDYSTRKGIKPELNSNALNPDWKFEKLGVGDKVYKNYTGFVMQEGAYAQGEYTMLDHKLNIVLAGSINNNTYWRRELMYADGANEKSKTANFIGGTIKGGVNYNIDKYNNVFFNVGYLSRAPFFQGGVFLQYSASNALNKDAVNEKIQSFEVGYGYHSRKFALTVNGYYTRWIDKTMAKGAVMDNGDRYSINLTGVNAVHMGVEVEANYVPVKWINIEGMLSVGNWKWNSNGSGYFYNNYGQPLANTNGDLASGVAAPDHLKGEVILKDRRIGGSPQTQGSLSLSFLPFKGFRIGADWVVEANSYSDYALTGSSLSNSGGAIKVADPWRIPWGQQFDMHASYRFKIGNVNATLYGNVYNLFNYHYIVDAYTPTTDRGTWENAYGVFYSFGRTYSIRMRINF